jgi:hypothetical protein
MKAKSSGKWKTSRRGRLKKKAGRNKRPRFRLNFNLPDPPRLPQIKTFIDLIFDHKRHFDFRSLFRLCNFERFEQLELDEDLQPVRLDVPGRFLLDGDELAASGILITKNDR